jgi:hypothetical protein
MSDEVAQAIAQYERKPIGLLAVMHLKLWKVSTECGNGMTK